MRVHDLGYASSKLVLAIAVFSLAFATAKADTMTLKTTADTMVRADSGNNNYGAAKQLIAGSLNTTFLRPSHLLLRFDLSDPLLTGATIDSVTLTTYAYSAGTNTPSLTLSAYALTAADSVWIEGAKDAVAATAGEPSWVNQAVGTPATPWAGGSGTPPTTPYGGASVPGTDYSSTMLASYTANPSTLALGTAMGFTSTTDFATTVHGDVGGTLNLILLNDVMASNFFRISSKEAGTTSGQYAAALNITYTPAPEPSSVLLLGTGAVCLVAWAWRKRK